jgi:hypothetical protein
MVLYFLLDVLDFPRGSKADCLTLLGRVVSVFSLSPPGVLGWFVAERSAAGFSHVTSNILVAGSGGTPLAERSLSGPPLDASIYSASMGDVYCYTCLRQRSVLAGLCWSSPSNKGQNSGKSFCCPSWCRSSIGWFEPGLLSGGTPS